MLLEMEEMPTEVDMPTGYNLDLRAWLRDVAHSNMVRHYPEWVEFVENDYVFNCDIIKSLEKINWCCVGWDSNIEQIKYLCIDTTHCCYPPRDKFAANKAMAPFANVDSVEAWLITSSRSCKGASMDSMGIISLYR
jgi:hypothetical protein